MSLQKVFGIFSFASDVLMKDSGRKQQIDDGEENKYRDYHNTVYQFYDFASNVNLQKVLKKHLVILDERPVQLPVVFDVLPASVVDAFFLVLVVFVVGASAI